MSSVPRRIVGVFLALSVLSGLAACGGSRGSTAGSAAGTAPQPSGSWTAGPTPAATPGGEGGAPSPNLYAAAGAGMLSPVVAGARPLAYVPNSDSNTVDVIDQATFRVVDHFRVGKNPQHVVPAWDLRTLYVANTQGDSLQPIDPKTGRLTGATIPVDDPYNMYFTPDGTSAIVVAEERKRLDFRDPHTFAMQTSVPVDCPGVDHVDFAADGSYLIATCEFSGKLVKVNLATRSVVGYLTLDPRDMPQDIKLDPQGKVFYVADMMAGGVYEVDGATLTKIGFLPTGKGTHGLYPSRDARFLYVSNRGEGSVSIIDFATRQVVGRWELGGKASPDMGGVSADGRVLWLSGRYSREVYAIDTGSGRLLARIPVGKGPHGMAVWPQPGRYSLGHTGILR